MSFAGRTILLLALVPGLIGSGAAEARDEPAGPARAAADPEAGRQDLRSLGLSLLLPGLAHLRAGERTRGLAFLLVEAGLWTDFAVSRAQGSMRKDSYIEMAELHAGVPRPEGRGEDYYRLIGTWPSSDMYNELIRREARTLYEDDLAGRSAYFETHQVPADRVWSWQTQAEWDRYRAKRADSRHAYRRARNMLGLAAANRAVAIIDAALLSRRAGSARALRLEMAPGPELGSATLRLRCLLP